MYSRAQQTGSSLIEVLISLVLVAVTMLGLLGLQLRSMTLQKDSLDRRTAAVLVAGLSDRISGNYDGFARDRAYSALAMGIADPKPLATTACAAVCTSAEVALRDWELFQIEVRDRLPNGVAGIQIVNNVALRVTVGWRDVQRDGGPAGQRESDLLQGTPADLNSNGVDDGCEAIGVNDRSFRCYVANVFP